MSKIKNEKAYSKKRISFFGGVQEGFLKKGDAASEIRNFRILPDGSLEKRNGWASLKLFSSPIRGFWQGCINNESYVFLVAQNTVYRILENNDTLVVGSLSTSLGKVHFRRYRNRLYLFDGSSIRIFKPSQNTFAVARGYVPLFGENWHPTNMGFTNEPANLLNRNLRIHYLNSTGTRTFKLPFYSESIDSIRVNNRVTTDYSFTTGSDQFTLSSANPGDIVEIAITVCYSDAMEQQLHGATESFLHRDGTHEKLLLYGAPEGYRVFCSSEITDLMLNFCSVYYDDCDPLYFKYNQILLIGDADHPVTAMTSNFDRILAFHTDGTHSIQIENDTIYSYPVLSNIGCSTKGAAIQIGNDSIVANERGICRLHATSSDPDSFSITNLSEALGKKRSQEISQNVILFWDNASQELWVRNINERTEGLVWVFNAVLNEWYCFDDIFATFFAVYNGQILFDRGAMLCVFDETTHADNGTPFTAYYQSGYLNFESVHSPKRSLRATVTAQTNRTGMALTLETERNSHIFHLEGGSHLAPEFFDVRLSPGRFRFLRYRISTTGSNAFHVYEADFFTTL